ncbi:outer membrane beta-barrel protein [Mucilaginibacter sp.]|uniref:outer membrane beta-barrel protein n=1 Tax=Mucilaginibacter sp. TaxID=1882438 RepID=UPI00261E6AC6|nr:outer membrane beta-barrel protein [Mucilaginibacter sp.]MDB4920942.1 hypothetical protein [Mucilaginibacter sp.]
MKKLNYLSLWQKKRSELPINDDPQSDWAEMDSLLNKHMPHTSQPTGKGKFNLKFFKILPKLFITLSAAAMVYTVSHIILSKSHQQQPKHKIHKGSQSVPDSSVIDTLNKDSINNIEDSLVLKNQVVADSSINNPGDYKNPANSSTANIDLKNKPAGSVKNSSTLVKPLLNKNRVFASNRTNNKLGTGFSIGKTNLSKTNLLGAGKNNALVSSVVNYSAFRSYNSEGEVGKPNNNENAVNNFNQNYPALQTTALQLSLYPGLIGKQPHIIQGSNYGVVKIPFLGTSKSIKDKKTKLKNLDVSNIDWGVLMGANASGSFTPAKQNANFYGSLPVDVYFGLFANYNLNNKWAIGSQIQILSAQNSTVNYTHANESKVDSGQSLRITTSGKLYSVNIPLHLVYKVTNNVSLKAGPVIGIPVKQTNINSTLQPNSIRSDSTYYSKMAGILNATKYEQKLNLGVSGGVNFHIKRFVFEATYLKSLRGYAVTNDLGSYRSGNGTVQFAIGFQLNKPKP